MVLEPGSVVYHLGGDPPIFRKVLVLLVSPERSAVQVRPRHAHAAAWGTPEWVHLGQLYEKPLAVVR